MLGVLDARGGGGGRVLMFGLKAYIAGIFM